MTVEAGSRLIAGVEVGGQPKPAIQWFKDDRPLASSGNVRFINEGLCSTVIINNTNVKNIERVKAGLNIYMQYILGKQHRNVLCYCY